jgi:hypothetical protein
VLRVGLFVSLFLYGQFAPGRSPAHH